MTLGSETCCICGKRVRCWHNPEPIRDGKQDCCDGCNLLVRAARERIFALPDEESRSFAGSLQKMSYTALRQCLLPEKEEMI